MPRPGPSQKVTVEDIHALIISNTPDGETPVMTVDDIAEHFDVSPPTIRPRMESVSKISEIKSRKIGRTTVYWYDRSAEFHLPLEEAIKQYKKAVSEDLLLARARWLDEVEQAKVSMESRETPSGEEASYLFSELIGYLQSVESATFIDFGAAMGQRYDVYNFGEDDLPLQLFDPEKFHMDSETVEYYLYDAELMADSPTGRVEGIADFQHLVFTARDRIDAGRSEFDPDEVPAEVWEEELPSPQQLINAGTVIDRFVTELVGWEW